MRFLRSTILSTGLGASAAFGQGPPPPPPPTAVAPAPVAPAASLSGAAKPDAVKGVATTPNVRLKIFAKGSGVSLSKVEVKIGAETLFSDPAGQVEIFVPASGDGTVAISRKGFERMEVKFGDLRPAGEFAIRLYPGQPDDDVIVVRGQRNNSVSRTTVSIEEAVKVAPGGDPAQIVKLLPGVQSAGGRGGGGSQIVVQGSGPHDSRYFIDDLEVPFIFHAIGNLSVIPGEMMQSVDFESAGFGTEYGDATGGIVTLRTKNDVPERAKTDFVFNIPFYSGVLYTAPLSETSAISAGVRRSYVDVFLKEYLNRRNKRSKDPSSNITIAPYFSDGEVQYLTKTEEGHTKVTMLGAYDGIKAVVPTSFASSSSGQSDINFSTGFADLGVEHEQRLDKDWKYVTTPQLYYYRTTANLDALVNGEQSVETFRVPTHLTRRLDKGENLYLGVDPDYTVANTTISAPRFTQNDPTFDPEAAPLVKSVDTERYASLASWVAIDQALGDLTLTPGVRAQYNGQTKKTSGDPRLRARYALNEDHSVKAAVGQYSESPQPLEASPGRGNPHLDFIRAYHYVLGLETKWNESWATDFSVFYKTAKNMVESDPETNYDNDGSLRSHGFEAMIRRNLTGRLFGWLAYTYSKTEERPHVAAPWRTAIYDQTHVGTLVGDYKFTGTWDFGGRYDYHTGSTYNTIDHAVFNADLDKYDARPSPSGINGGRLPASNTLSLYFGHDALYDNWKLAMRLGIEEFWFSPQVEGIRYSYNYRKAEQSTSLTSIPFFELKGEL